MIPLPPIERPLPKQTENLIPVSRVVTLSDGRHKLLNGADCLGVFVNERLANTTAAFLRGDAHE